MAKVLTLPIEDNMGYSPDQIRTAVTLQELLEAVQDAIQEHGADATVILDNGQQYGAQFGQIRDASMGHEWFQEADTDTEF